MFYLKKTKPLNFLIEFDVIQPSNKKAPEDQGLLFSGLNQQQVEHFT